MGISDATFYNRKKRYGGVDVSKLQRLSQFEDESQRLKRMVAELSPDIQFLQDALSPKFKTPSIALSFRTFWLRPYMPPNDDPTQLCSVTAPCTITKHGAILAKSKSGIKRIAATRVRNGYERVHVLLRLNGWRVNHRKVLRLYQEEGMNRRRQ